jgi:hypothetical protein
MMHEDISLQSEILHKTENVCEIYKAPRMAPEAYPGEHPETSGSLIDGDNIYSCLWNKDSKLFHNVGDFDPVLETADGFMPLDDYLRSKNVPTLGERYPLTAFGSNRSPGQLLDKFRRKETGDTQETTNSELEIVPMFMGTLKGYDAVYNSKPGNMGYFFADLYQGAETKDTEIEVAVLFLTKEQLDILHASEKAYDFKLLGEVEVGKTLIEDQVSGDTFTMPAFAHVGKATAYADKTADGKKPIALSEVYAAGRQLTNLNQVAFQERFFANDPNGERQKALAEISGDPQVQSNSTNYIANMKMERAGGMRSLAERKELQSKLLASLRDDEVMTIDPEQFEATTVDPESQPIPDVGAIAVFNFLASAGKKS